ncbi:hypothetical protein BDD21_3644 [Thiocapsa rosea]|uniref:Uncharacterized protein n=1 Tax=Thiocapsa rosea TaxID=69360 RepID=A0A495VCJ2_9GAMM|nr:hypothetical protein BDD21_3644 [Thiocapsa rosea]
MRGAYPACPDGAWGSSAVRQPDRDISGTLEPVRETFRLESGFRPPAPTPRKGPGSGGHRPDDNESVKPRPE